jgi:hypothetical protein
VSLAGISDRQKISLSYLEQLFGKLRRYGLVESVRGPGGGYCLARPTNEMTVTDIIRAVDEPLAGPHAPVVGHMRHALAALVDDVAGRRIRSPEPEPLDRGPVGRRHVRPRLDGESDLAVARRK